MLIRHCFWSRGHLDEVFFCLFGPWGQGVVSQGNPYQEVLVCATSGDCSGADDLTAVDSDAASAVLTYLELQSVPIFLAVVNLARG